jgi:hypothetical protein
MVFEIVCGHVGLIFTLNLRYYALALTVNIKVNVYRITVS